MKMILAVTLLFLGLSSAMAQGLVSHYTSIDFNKCSATTENKNFQTFQCPGPDNAILYITSGPWTNLLVKYKGRFFDTWDLLNAISPSNHLGGEARAVEWILNGFTENHTKLQSLILPVIGMHPTTRLTNSKFLVFGFSPLGVCYRGDAATITRARHIAEVGRCLKAVPIRLP